MGFFKNITGSWAVAKPFNAVMESNQPLYTVHVPKWWNEDGRFFLLQLKAELVEKNPLLALAFDNFSNRTFAAIAASALYLEDRGYTEDEIIELIAVQIVSFCRMRGGVGALTKK